MAIPSEKDFNELIDVFFRLNQQYLLTENIENDYVPTELNCNDYASEIYEAWIERTSIWHEMPAQVWLEKQPGYWLGMDLLFGEIPRRYSRSKSVKMIADRLLASFKPISEDNYAEYVASMLEEREDSIALDISTRDAEKKEASEGKGYAVEGGVEDDYFETDQEIRENAEEVFPIITIDKMNSEDYRLEKFRRTALNYSMPRGQFDWIIFFVEKLRDYFYKNVNLSIEAKKKTDNLDQLEQVVASAHTLIKYFEERYQNDIDIADFRGEIGPVIGESRELIRRLEFQLIEIRDELEFQKEIIKKTPMFQRDDKSIKERMFVISIWQELRTIRSPRMRIVAAISHFLSFEGIENNLDERSIRRIIRKAKEGGHFY